MASKNQPTANLRCSEKKTSSFQLDMVTGDDRESDYNRLIENLWKCVLFNTPSCQPQRYFFRCLCNQWSPEIESNTPNKKLLENKGVNEFNNPTHLPTRQLMEDRRIEVRKMT